MNDRNAKAPHRMHHAWLGCRGHGDRWKAVLAGAGLMLGALAPASGLALPQGGNVAAGSATVSTPSPTSMRINQTTDRLIIDWAQFNIAANESVRFLQPSPASRSGSPARRSCGRR